MKVIMNEFLPELGQFLSSPTYPALQVQLYEPIVLLHTATWLQVCSPVEHSSISGNTVNKLVKSPLTFTDWEWGSRAGAVVIALAFH